jgi:hypothetical protein
LADVDPISLTIRSGLSFDYVIFLVAQSLVWCYLGVSTMKLVPLGLADCRAVAKLVQGLKDNPADADLIIIIEAAATALGVPRSCVEMNFKNIAADSYTRFIVVFAE